MEKLILSAVQAVLAIFKGTITKVVDANAKLKTLLSWIQTITTDINDIVAGQPMPPLNTGNAWLDGLAPMLVNIVSHLSSVEAILPVLGEISTIVQTLIDEIDPQATAESNAAAQNSDAPAATSAPANLSVVDEVISHIAAAKSIIVAMSNPNASKAITEMDTAANKLNTYKAAASIKPTV